jgi:PTH1 family peptidyl-tRNA hydrolase
LCLEHIAQNYAAPWRADLRTKSNIAHIDRHTLLKPDVFMNNSGISVGSYAKLHKITPDHIIVAHDDLDLSIGQWKLSYGKGPPLHGGINSIEMHLKTKLFWRLRIGVEDRNPDMRIPGSDYVLQDFTDTQRLTVSTEFDRMFQALASQFGDKWKF